MKETYDYGEIDAVKPPKVLHVEGCARCNADHDVTFREFRWYPPRVAGAQATHWGMCPTLNEPVLMRVEEKPETA